MDLRDALTQAARWFNEGRRDRKLKHGVREQLYRFADFGLKLTNDQMLSLARNVSSALKGFDKRPRALQMWLDEAIEDAKKTSRKT